MHLPPLFLAFGVIAGLSNLAWAQEKNLLVAARCGLDSAGVLNGYREELRRHSVDALDAAAIRALAGISIGFSERALASFNSVMGCMETVRQTFLFRYDNARAADALRAAYGLFALTPADDDEKFGLEAESLAMLAAKMREGFFSNQRPLNDIGARLGLVPAKWSAWRDAATQGVTDKLRQDIMNDFQEGAGAIAVYVIFADAALALWSESADWVMNEAFPELVNLHARRAFHRMRVVTAERDYTALRAVAQSLDPKSDMAVMDADPVIGPTLTALTERISNEQSCVDGLTLALANLYTRIEMIAALPFLESFESDGIIVSLIVPDDNLPNAPIACAISADPAIARVAITPLSPPDSTSGE